MGGRDPFAGRWGSQISSSSRLGFGSSNERGGRDDEIAEDSSYETKDEIDGTAISTSKLGSQDIKEEDGSIYKDPLGRDMSTVVEQVDAKPKRRSRKNNVPKLKEEREMADQVHLTKKRKGMSTAHNLAVPLQAKATLTTPHHSPLLLYRQPRKPPIVPSPALVLAMAGVMVPAGRLDVRAVQHIIIRWQQ